MPFSAGCFAPEFFFNPEILAIVTHSMGERVVADQWGCDVPLRGSEYQDPHADYQRALFEELPDLPLPAYMLVVSFGLGPITDVNGAIEMAAGTHRMPRTEALRRMASGEIQFHPVALRVGDVLIRHPWTLHRGTPNSTDEPRALVSIRYVREWYWDKSRTVSAMPIGLWEALTPQQQRMMRFPREA
jgi:ectoine hydroxylase-related dioxygenase (phytanoyl-CoA dioxygenase family)